MSEEEVRRSEVLSRVMKGQLRLTEASELLQISYRQAKRLKRRYRQHGAKGLVHGSVGRSSNRAKPQKFRKKVLGLVREHYGGAVGSRFGPTLAAEQLEQDHGLRVDEETLRRWMLSEGLWSRERRRHQHRRRRERKAHFGELVQMDGSFHEWLEQRGPRGCLMNMVDDATGITQAQFSAEETTWAAADLLRAWIELHGVPQALYTDWKNVYVRQPSSQELITGVTAQTQFGQMCAALGIDIIAASSPQAKGRIERSHGVHQDRLIKKMRLKRISNYEQANRYLADAYLDEHNRRFARAADQPNDYHRRAPARSALEQVFCLRHERKLSLDWVVCFDGRRLQLERQQRVLPKPRQTITIQQWRDGRLELRFQGHLLRWQEISEQLKRLHAAPLVRHKPWKPAASHPWRQPALRGEARRQLAELARSGSAGLRSAEASQFGA
jgi:transposase